MIENIKLIISYFWAYFDKLVLKLSIFNIICLLLLFTFVFGFIAGNITGTYLTSKYYIELVNITANQNNSVLELNNLEGNTYQYEVYYKRPNTLNYSNITILEIGD